MLDLFTVRVVQVCVAVCVVLLFYFVTYRQTRSRFAFYWTIIVLLSGIGASLYLLNGTPAAVIANPLANALSVLIAALVWAACRAFTLTRVPWWALVVGPVIALVAGLVDDPATNDWAGGEVLLAGVAVYLGLASYALWSTRDRAFTSVSRRRADGGAREIVTSMAAMATLFAAYYAWRLAVYLAVGPESDAFELLAGGVPTAIGLILVNVVTTFAMTSLSAIERMNDLRVRATTDGLTGLLTRVELFAQLAQWRARDDGVTHAVVLADLDRFKDLNDTYGHAAGDAALRRFGAICRRVLDESDLAGRIGGEEFAFVLAGADLPSVQAVTTTISRLYAAHPIDDGVAHPTISFGVSFLGPDEDVEDAWARADAALYRAKREGRDRLAVG